MTQSDAEAMEEHSKFLWNSEIWRVTVNVQHRFEDGYEPSDMDSLRLDLRQLQPNPVGRTKYRHVGSVWIDVSSCGLRLERAGEVVVACGDPSEKVLAGFKELVGRALVSVDISAPGGVPILLSTIACCCVVSRRADAAARAGVWPRRVMMNCSWGRGRVGPIEAASAKTLDLPHNQGNSLAMLGRMVVLHCSVSA